MWVSRLTDVAAQTTVVVCRPSMPAAATIFTIEDDVVVRIAGALAMKLTTSGRSRPRPKISRQPRSKQLRSLGGATCRPD